jgi:tryptophan-rich sensory protein
MMKPMITMAKHRYGWIIWIAVIWGMAHLVAGSFPREWYQALCTRHPPLWLPPSYVFGPVWGVLYAMIGIAGWRLWRMDASSTPLVRSCRRLFVAQMLCNWSWMPVFFHLRFLGGALIIIGVMDLLVWRLIIRSYRLSHTTAWLLVPYGCWLLFATYLNSHFWWSTNGMM